MQIIIIIMIIIIIFFTNFTLRFLTVKLAMSTFKVKTQQVKRKYKKKQNDYKWSILYL